ncbi:MAG: SMC-Scp complex subunit ScpB [Elusimicrobia bacterium]|nr:SMC-Scp complex subunit ScpB [Elusimicrobiota bacterium]
MEEQELKAIIETLLFITDHPLPVSRLCQVLDRKDEAEVLEAVNGLKRTYDDEKRPLQINEIAGGFQMATRSEYGQWVRRLFHSRMTIRLSTAALETLSIIAYKQPITRAEVESIRGVEVIGPLETLIERRLITIVGRKETVGRPLLYGTTMEFLRQFGLKSLDDLPRLDTLVIEQKEEKKPESIQENSMQVDSENHQENKR